MKLRDKINDDCKIRTRMVRKLKDSFMCSDVRMEYGRLMRIAVVV